MYIPIPIVIGAVALILILLLVRRPGSSPRDLLAPPRPIDLSGDVESEVRSLAMRGDKIAAIKLIRECSGLGLKEAKDMIDRMELES